MAERHVHTCVRVLGPDLGDGYNHIAIAVDDLDALLAELAKLGVEPEEPPFAPGGARRSGASASCGTRTATASS